MKFVDIAALALPTEAARYVIAHGFDDYTTNIPLADCLDDDALARAMTACRAWHDVACGSAWADKAWRARGDDAVRAFERRGGADAACAAAVRKEGGRRHCSARGRFLAMAFTPACQLRRRARRRRREADAAARRWAEERRQAERELQRATRRLRIVLPSSTR